MHRLIVSVCVFVLSCGLVRADDPTPEQIEFFEQHIRPLLVEHCGKCHGEQQQKGGLRIDSRQALLLGGDSGPSIVPSKPEDSELIRAVHYDPDGYQMPPAGKLPADKIALLEKWVADGAPWPEEVGNTHVTGDSADEFAKRAEHWSFQPLQKPSVPVVQRSDWPRNPIDRFILQALETRGLTPAGEAPHSVWLRRGSFDVLGLPPTLEQLDSVEGDENSGRQIDEWLAAPQFGERWGRHWLDLVRYAESRGHEFDFDVPNGWHYRDYVIRALNADVPYDQLVVEHVAGDLLRHEPAGSRFVNRVDSASGDSQSILGTGFWFFGEWVHSPVDLKQDEADRLNNMVEVFGKAFLGLTVSCARCHDHKFDPISQKDYSALSSYVASAAYVQTPFEALEHNRRISEQITTLDDQAAAILRDWLEAHRDQLPQPAPVAPASAFEPSAEQLIVDFRSPEAEIWSDGSCFGTRSKQPGDIRWSDNADRPLAQVVTTPAVERDPAFRAFRPSADVMEDVGLSNWKRAGRTLITPSFIVGPGKVYAWVRGGCRTYAAVNSHLTIMGPLHGSLLRDHPAADEWRWIEHDLSRYQGHLAHLEFVLREDDDFSVALVVQGDAPPPPLMPESIPGALEALNTALSDGQVEALQDLHQQLRPLYEQREALKAQIRMSSAAAPAMLEGNGVDLPLFVRGNPHKPGPPVPRQFLEVFQNNGPHVEDDLPRRLDLAHQVVDPVRNPIVARLIVNRIWQHYFGVGLVSSADDFGLMGTEPSHPELLDWLAIELISHDWSMKHIHRLILDSATYRMASYLPPDADEEQRRAWAAAAETDPSNIWLHRMPIKRLEGEALRDAILTASDRLDGQMYGRSVPLHLTEHHDGRGKPSVSGPLDGDGRRSIYLAVRRNFPDPLLQAFDFPVPSTTRGRRSVSNVPAQALALMNNPLIVQQSARFAERVISDPRFSSDHVDQLTSRVQLAFRIAYSREPSPAEREQVRDFLQAEAVERQTTVDDPQVWADLCHALINSKEFLFVP